MNEIIVINRVMCTKCKDIILSGSIIEKVTCKCGNISICGKNNSLKRSWINSDSFVELSEIIYLNNKYNVDRNSFKQEQFDYKCLKCNSIDILVHRYDYNYMVGNNCIGYTCNKCKCLYLFNDIDFIYNKKN